MSGTGCFSINPTAEIESKSLWPQTYVLKFHRTGTKDLCSEMSLFQIYCMLSYYTVSHTLCPLGQYTTVLHIATAHAPHTATRAYLLVYCAVSSEMLYDTYCTYVHKCVHTYIHTYVHCHWLSPYDSASQHISPEAVNCVLGTYLAVHTHHCTYVYIHATLSNTPHHIYPKPHLLNNNT